MELTLSLTLVVSFSFLVSGLLQRTRLRHFTRSSVYLGVGVLSGPEVFGLLDSEAITQLAPFIAVTLGCLGFIQGLPLTRRLREAVREFEAGLLTSVLALGAVALVAYLVLDRLVPKAGYPALTLGAAAVATSRPIIGSTVARMRAKGAVTDLVRSMALIGDVVAVLLSGFALAVAVADASALRLGLGPVVWIAASTGIGVACGLLFRFFMLAEASRERIFLATVGIIVFSSGLASAVGISALLLNGLAGVTVALTARDKDPSAPLGSIETPASIALMIFAGAMWSSSSVLGLPALAFVAFAVGLAGLRLVALTLAGRVAIRLVPRAQYASRVGYGLLPMGGLAIGIALNYRLLDLPAANLVLTAVAGAAILTEIVSFDLLSVLLVDAGEVTELERAHRRFVG